MTSDLGLRFHHFGLAAKHPKLAERFVSSTGYTCGTPIVDPLQGVSLRWCTGDRLPSIEIVSPIDVHGPLARILHAQESSFYHLCYEVDTSSASALSTLREQGHRVMTVMSAKPAILFGGRLVSFHVVQGFGLIELLEPLPEEAASE